MMLPPIAPRPADERDCGQPTIIHVLYRPLQRQLGDELLGGILAEGQAEAVWEEVIHADAAYEKAVPPLTSFTLIIDQDLSPGMAIRVAEWARHRTQRFQQQGPKGWMPLGPRRWQVLLSTLPGNTVAPHLTRHGNG
jgi:hypothetical protein